MDLKEKHQIAIDQHFETLCMLAEANLTLAKKINTQPNTLKAADLKLAIDNAQVLHSLLSVT